MAVYIDTEQVAGIAGIPSLTLEQYNALEVKPKLWFLLNPPEEYQRLSADEVSYDGTSSGLSATNTQGAIDEVKGKTDTKADTSSVNAILPQLFFGNNKGRYYTASVTSVDALVNGVSPTTDSNGFFTVDNTGSIPGLGNRQFAFGWLNSGKTYGWIMVLSFVKPQFGTRYGANTFTMHDLY